MPGEYYLPIYLTVISLMTFYKCAYYSRANAVVLDNRGAVNNSFSFLLALCVALFIGLRPQAGCFVDSNNYIESYNAMEGNEFVFNPEATNFIFDNLFAWMASHATGWSAFFLVIALIYFFGMWITCRKMFPRDAFVAFLTCLAAFSTFSYGTNGIKAGAAASLFLIAVAYHKNLIVAALFLFLSLGFHHSMVLPIVAFVLAYFYKNIKVYFIGWVMCFLLAMFHVTYFQALFAGISDEQGAGYLMSSGQDWGGQEGFRFDFVLYSAMPVLVGYWTTFRKKIVSRSYNFLLSIYLATNGVWMLCMYVNFTNRIAYLSWFLYPVVLIYPFLNENLGWNRYKTLAKVVCLHLLFTLFMNIVYY